MEYTLNRHSVFEDEYKLTFDTATSSEACEIADAIDASPHFVVEQFERHMYTDLNKIYFHVSNAREDRDYHPAVVKERINDIMDRY